MGKALSLLLCVLSLTTLCSHSFAFIATSLDYPVAQWEYRPGSYDGRTFYFDGDHLGEDIMLPEKKPIRAIGHGTLVWYSSQSGYGELVAVIEHDLGEELSFTNAYGNQITTRKILSIYGHIRAGEERGGDVLKWKVGDEVRQGDIIGYVNNSSHPDAEDPDPNGDGLEHLHMGIRLSDKATAVARDPRGWFRGYEDDTDFGKDYASASKVIKSLRSPPVVSSTWLSYTGQTKCYSDAGEEIACPPPRERFYGQDGNYYVNARTAFRDNHDGTVSDLNTGLVWQQADDQNNLERTWQEAVDYCAALDLAGKTDWRLPNRTDLMSIVNYGRHSPSIDTDYFPDGRSNGYWGGNGPAGPDHAAIAYFDNGLLSRAGKSDAHSVRCVREESLPPGAYVDNLDGTVSDFTTGLVWQRSDDGIARSWEEALAYCKGLDLAGRTHWRLPNIKELDSILKLGSSPPALDPIFSCRPNAYWSSTTVESNPENGWYVSFGGDLFYLPSKSSQYFVRCVHSNFRSVKIPPIFETAQEIHAQISQGERHQWDFINDSLQELVVKLGFDGTFNIEIYRPDGTLFDELQSGSTPIEAFINNAEPGQWCFTVTALDVPYLRSPYVLMIGESRASTASVSQTWQKRP